MNIKVKVVVLAAALFGVWGIVAVAEGGPQESQVASTQMDITTLMSQAGNLPAQAASLPY